MGLKNEISEWCVNAGNNVIDEKHASRRKHIQVKKKYHNAIE
jgi:hypothetical protein